jgi:hypothetical protein
MPTAIDWLGLRSHNIRVPSKKARQAGTCGCITLRSRGLTATFQFLVNRL